MNNFVAVTIKNNNGVIKFLFMLLLLNSLFSGVDFSQLGFPKGFSSLADFFLKITIILIVMNTIKIEIKYIIYMLFILLFLIFGAIVGMFYNGGESDKTFSLIFNVFLWVIIYFYAQKLEASYKLFDFFLRIIILTTIISLCLYGLAFLGFNTKLLDSTWLYDQHFRFSSTFNEPSLSGYFFGLMFLLVYFSMLTHRLKLLFLFMMATLLSGAKFTLVIVPVLLVLSLFTKIKGFHTSLGTKLIVFSVFIVYISLPLLYPSFFALISTHNDNNSTMTYVTRFGFPITSIFQSFDYPLGTGFFGFKTTLAPYVQRYCLSIANLNVDCSEFSSYLNQSDLVARESYAPKDVLSFIILTYGLVGLIISVIVSITISSYFKDNKRHFILFVYILTSMLFVLPFRFVLFFTIFIFQCYIYREKGSK